MPGAIANGNINFDLWRHAGGKRFDGRVPPKSTVPQIVSANHCCDSTAKTCHRWCCGAQAGEGIAKLWTCKSPSIVVLARVVSLQASNRYKMQLEGLEDQLLQRLADAPADILADVALIEVWYDE